MHLRFVHFQKTMATAQFIYLYINLLFVVAYGRISLATNGSINYIFIIFNVQIVAFGVRDGGVHSQIK